ncbi:hypothetical protein EB796_000963 [Bugula neritina]|uniref:DDE Tnp4 domain-containing protein n=1 Tax=Bugula neritina TaxID=10212 RepID=A0A7J7KRF1_BUGNE|nr:hypothetical protein EB796_000963 [Bugula neritina]
MWSRRRHSDGEFFGFKAIANIQNGTINFPLPEVPEQGTELLPFVIVGDKAFPLRPFLMRPSPNHTPGRCLLMKRPIYLEPHKVKVLTLACCILRNIIRQNR